MRRKDDELAGWVYLIGDDNDDSPVKIGYATSPSARLASIQTGSSQKLGIILCIGGTRETEKAFHKAFADLRVQGEWFRDREVIHHCMDMLFERVLDRWEEADRTPCDFDEFMAMAPATPEEVAAEAVETLRYYEYVRRTDDWNLEADDAPKDIF